MDKTELINTIIKKGKTTKMGQLTSKTAEEVDRILLKLGLSDILNNITSKLDPVDTGAFVGLTFAIYYGVVDPTKGLLASLIFGDDSDKAEAAADLMKDFQLPLSTGLTVTGSGGLAGLANALPPVLELYALTMKAGDDPDTPEALYESGEYTGEEIKEVINYLEEQIANLTAEVKDIQASKKDVTKVEGRREETLKNLDDLIKEKKQLISKLRGDLNEARRMYAEYQFELFVFEITIAAGLAGMIMWFLKSYDFSKMADNIGNLLPFT
jgi:hypothetical protein